MTLDILLSVIRHKSYVLKLIRSSECDRQRVKVPRVSEVRGAAVVTDKVVVVERVEVDAPVVVQFVAYS